MRRSLALLALAVLLGVLAGAAPAGTGSLPQTIALPNGWQPEGIAAGPGTQLYVGSTATGAIWAGDARTGMGSVRVPAREGRTAVGIEVDRLGRILVAGGEMGDGFVYDARTGGDLASYPLTAASETFVNDVAVTRRAAYFTDSRNQRLYVVPLGRRGALPDAGAVRILPLTGDLRYVAGFNLNGIVAARGGRVLIAVQTNTGRLFTIDPRTGSTRAIDFGGAAPLTNGDGLLLRGRTLWVVRNQDNEIAVVRLAGNLRSGRIAGRLTDPDLDVPTTIARSAGALYAVNARFTTPPGPDVPYAIVRVG
jgi:sugar lactone lactonase YvrE